MGTKTRFGIASAAVAALLSFLLGCGTSPTAPQNLGGSLVQGGNSSPPMLKVNPDGSVSYVQLTQVNASGTIAAQSSSAKIDGNRGGTVTCGRFTVIVPPGAFVGPATITVSVADPTVLICDLSIAPQAANKFKVPVQLVTDLSNLNVSPGNQTIYWYNPTQNLWVDMDAAPDASAKTVTANLNHFSKYGAGKAGW